MAKLTVHEALNTLKSLKERYSSLERLRNDNSRRTISHYGVGKENKETTEPTYSVKALDKLMNKFAGHVRKLDAAIKASNVVTKLDYDFDETLLDEDIEEEKK